MLQGLTRSLRQLNRSRFFAVATILILAVGIGATTAVFSLLDAVLLRPLPYADASRLVRIEQTTGASAPSPIPATYFQHLETRTNVFQQIVPFLRDTVTLTGGGEPEQVIAVRSRGLLPLLGVPARLGRTLTHSDDHPGAAPVAVLSDRLWRRRFHADPAILGRAITISGEAVTVAGIMEPDFEFRYPEAELWMPAHLTPTSPWLQVAARLRPDISPAQAASALQATARQIQQDQPASRGPVRFAVTPWSEMPEEKYRLTLIFVMAAAGLVLLAACANVSGLLLGRALERRREIAIHGSLGAGPGRIAWQCLAESLALALPGAVAGLALGHLGVEILTSRLAALPIALPHLGRAGLNGRVLAFTTAVCLLVAVLCSLAPVLAVARTGLESLLRGTSAGAGVRRSSRPFRVLIAVEAGLAFLLLTGSGLMVRSLLQLRHHDSGLRPQHVLTLRVPVGTFTQPRPTGKYDTRPRQIAYYREILERAGIVPGVAAAAIVNNLPLSGINSSLLFDLPGSLRNQALSARTISPRYFEVMGIPLLAGRDFTEADQASSPAVAIINQRLGNQLFPGLNPLGQKLAPTPQASGPTVVGVVRDTPQSSYELQPTGEVYIPYRQYIFTTFMSTLVVRAAGDPRPLAAALKNQVWAIDPTQPIVKVETLEDVI